MSQFADLPESKHELLRHLRAFGCRADDVIRTHPLLALLYLRQLNEAWYNAKPERYSKFHDHWHQLLHANVAPATYFDDDAHRDAAIKAARLLYTSLATELNYPNKNWTLPPAPTSADSFTDLHGALVALDNAVNRRAGHSDAPRDAAADAAALANLHERAQQLQTVSGAQRRLLTIYLASIATAIANHQGRAKPGHHGEVSAETLRQALASASADQQVAIEYVNRLAINATNRLDVDAAFQLIDPLHRDFASATHWRNEAIGALFGTFGIVYALLAERDRDPAYLELADAHFAKAREHFDLPGDLLRQRVYALHSAISHVRLAPDDDTARKTLLERLLEAETVLGDRDLDRRDYLIGAYLKGCDVLGRSPEAYNLCVHAVGNVLADLDAAVADPMAHGLVCATGWLVLTKGEAAPKAARKFLERYAAKPGLVALIARLFLAERARRNREPTDVAQAFAGIAPDDRATWAKFLGEAMTDATVSLIARVPFNFA